MPQVDQIPFVAPDKMLALQLGLHLVEGAPHDIGPLLRVEVQAVVQHLHIAHVSGGNLPDAVSGGDHQALAGPAVEIGKGLFQLEGEGKVVHGLEHEAQRLHLVAADGILGHVGDEEEQHLAVGLPDLPGGGHAVQMGHLDVQQYQVVDGTVALRQLQAVGKTADLQLLAGLTAVPAEIFLQLLGAGSIVLHNGDAKHAIPPLSLGVYTHIIILPETGETVNTAQQPEKRESGRESGKKKEKHGKSA